MNLETTNQTKAKFRLINLEDDSDYFKLESGISTELTDNIFITVGEEGGALVELPEFDLEKLVTVSGEEIVGAHHFTPDDTLSIEGREYILVEEELLEGPIELFQQQEVPHNLSLLDQEEQEKEERLNELIDFDLDEVKLDVDPELFVPHDGEDLPVLSNSEMEDDDDLESFIDEALEIDEPEESQRPPNKLLRLFTLILFFLFVLTGSLYFQLHKADFLTNNFITEFLARQKNELQKKILAEQQRQLRLKEQLELERRLEQERLAKELEEAMQNELDKNDSKSSNPKRKRNANKDFVIRKAEPRKERPVIRLSAGEKNAILKEIEMLEIEYRLDPYGVKDALKEMLKTIQDQDIRKKIRAAMQRLK